LAENVWLTVATDTPAMRATSTIVATVVIVKQNVLRVNEVNGMTGPARPLARPPSGGK
jgi:hypothetical protein